MKQPNPLLPQGTFESQARGKSHVRIAVFTILAVHVVVLGALLIQGCKRTDDKDTAAAAPTNDMASIPPFAGSNEVVVPGTGAPPITSSLPATAALAPTSPPIAVPAIPSIPSVPSAIDAPLVTEHTVVKGDSFATIAPKYGVTVKAIEAANPTVDPKKLQVGQKIKIPAKTAAVSHAATVATMAPGDAGDLYAVKSGDTLGKIATAHGTTVKSIQKLNNLTTTQIKVGQKLKMPAHAAAPATATPIPGGATPSTAPPAVPSPAPAQ